MADLKRGIYRKFIIERADGSSDPGGKHEHCTYFVLDMKHDPFARPALEAYAKACKETHPLLAADIQSMLTVSDLGMSEAMQDKLDQADFVDDLGAGLVKRSGDP